MSDSSQPKKSTEDLVNDILISASGTGLSSDCITITLPNDIISSGGTYDYNMNSASYTLTSSQASPVYTINTLNTLNDSITIGATDWNWGEEWVDKLPDWERLKDMRSQYPSLDIALRNLETIYKLVKDDYDNPTPKK